MDVVMNLCDPVIVMAYGKVLAQGSPAVIQNDQAVLEAYLGEVE
jgi:branched-chain amino acid transport system ATP-binding protein